MPTTLAKTLSFFVGNIFIFACQILKTITNDVVNFEQPAPILNEINIPVGTHLN